MTTASFASQQQDFFKDPKVRGAQARLERLSWIMDSALRVPGTNFRLGADAIVGILPGAGNLATSAVSGYLVWEAWRLGVPRRLLTRMIGNVALDSVVSSVPVLGTVADMFWKANRKNMALLNEHLRSSPSGPSATIEGEWRRVS